jgi:hypothetical protein
LSSCIKKINLMDKRPELNRDISIEDFSGFYWLKEELVEFCHKEGLRKQGGKIQIAYRIENYLRTGCKEDAITKKATPISNFDWNHANLTLKTIITDNYRNTENARIFFKNQIGQTFKFNVTFMNWMKHNTGKKLEDAVNEWKKIDIEKRNNKQRKKIAPQFEYNRYIRDFLEDNPQKSKNTAIQFWKIKRSMRGDNIYKKSDLNLMV